MADKQFYEYKLEADTTTESGSLPFINDLFLDIVNYDEVNPYYLNSWYKELLDHVPEEKSQKAKFWWTKMLPYKQIQLWKRVNDELVEDTTDYIITDAVFLDGVRYLMAVYDDYTKMKIFKQIFVDEIYSCANNEWESGFTGKFVDISRYIYINNEEDPVILDYYPFDKCCDMKFTTAAWGKWQAKQVGNSWYMKVEQVWDNIFYYFYDDNEIINAAAGDYLYINKWWLSWQIVPLSWSTTIDWFQWVETIFAWTWVNIQEDAEYWLSAPHWWVIYPTYWDILHFTCADGVMHLNYSNMTPAETEVTICGSMYTNTNNLVDQPNFLISSMISFHPIDTIALYDITDGDIKYWLSWFLKFYFKATNQYFISNDFTDIIEFTDYIVLVGPSKTWLAYPYTDPNKPGMVLNMYRDIGDGYITRWSWISDGSTFILANSKWLRALELNATYAVESRFGIVPSWKFQAGPFITDISHFSRELWDEMWMSMENKQFKMFITNDEWTIVWIKSIEHNYRRQHIMPEKYINNFKANIYIGDGIYGRWWDEEVKTYLAFSFWDKSLMIPKMFHSLKLALGRDSWLSKGNTILQITWTLSGRSYTVNYSDRDTSIWIQEMMNLKLSGNEDQDYREYWNEIEIASWEWHGKKTPKMLYNTNKIKAFKDYDPQREVVSDFDNQYTLANRSTVHTDLWYMGDMVTFKLITRWNNNLEFYWAQIWYDLTNEVGWSLDNSLVVKASADDGSSPNVPK